jgi:peroxiredoxin
MLKKISLAILALLLISLLLLTYRYFSNPTQPNSNASAAILFETSFPNENGENKSLKPYKGKIIVLNFWATWCEPCREEMPELSTLHTAYQHQNVVVLGMALDDVTAIKDFVAETKVSYPLFAAEGIGNELSSSLGNDKGVLPYTVIIKPDGFIAKTYFGRISKALLDKTLVPLMQK